jgi:hypothetical protein
VPHRWLILFLDFPAVALRDVGPSAQHNNSSLRDAAKKSDSRMPCSVVEYDDPQLFHDIVGPDLLTAEAANGLLLGLIRRVIDRGTAAVPASELRHPRLSPS